MKFMKLGSKADTFQADGKWIRYVTSDLATDVTINVGEVKFHLHKFPLLSKSNRMQKLLVKANEDNTDEITLSDFPGGPKEFEICAKFCYGMTVTLNAYNVVATRCAAEYLEMAEDVDHGNLIYKIEVFLNSGIFRSWKDSIIVLQSTKSLLPWSEDLKIVGRCIDSISAKTSVDPKMITWSYTFNRKLSAPDKIVEVREKKFDKVPEDWWVEDVCELEIDMFKRVINAVKSKGRMNGGVLAEALRYYVERWLPESMESLAFEGSGNKRLVETIVFLLPRQSGTIYCCSCSFLMKLLKIAILVGADDSVKEDLVKNISFKLHEARVQDLLVHEVELVHRIVEQYVMNEKRDSDDDRYKEFVLGNGSLLGVGRLIDAYLAEIAPDQNIPLSTFVELSKLLPDSARPIHDNLYNAIDTFLKEHPSLTKSEKRKLCSLMDVRKLTAEASMHAAQNERLPLRVVVQVLYFEQVRTNNAAAAVAKQPTYNNSNNQTKKNVKDVGDRDGDGEGEAVKKLSKKSGNSKSTRSGSGGAQLTQSRSRRILEKLWPGKIGENSNKSSEISSGSSQSPTAKSSGSSSRRRRHSIS